MRWFWDLLQRYIDWSRDASGIANAIQIATPVLTIGGATIGLARALARRMLRDKEAEIYLLKKDLDRKARDLVEVTSERNQWDRRCVDLQERLAETALDRANIERSEGQHPAADRILARWVETEGEAISRLLFCRATWAAAYATGELRAMGLLAAEAYATAAMAFWPSNRDAIGLLADVATLREQEGQNPPSLREALQILPDRAVEVFDANLADQANKAEGEARRRLVHGQYHAALPAVERAVLLRVRTLGKASIRTATTKHLQAQILLRLGRFREALVIVQQVLAAQEASEALGPSHPSTLPSRILVAQILMYLGRYDEALKTAVAPAHEVSEALGPSHPDTLLSRVLVAKILMYLGRNDEALKTAEAVASAQEASEALLLTPTLSSRVLVAPIL